jgi:hypothetical protein
MEKAKLYSEHGRRFTITSSDVTSAINIVNELDHPSIRFFGFITNNDVLDNNDNNNDDNDNTTVNSFEYNLDEVAHVLNDDSNGTDDSDADYVDSNDAVISNENSNISNDSSNSSSSSSSSSSSYSTSSNEKNDTDTNTNTNDDTDCDPYIKVKKHIKYYIILSHQAAKIDIDVHRLAVPAFNILQLAIEGKIMDSFLNTNERQHHAFKNIPKLHHDSTIRNVTPLTNKESETLIETLKMEQHKSDLLLIALENYNNIKNELAIKDIKIKELEELLSLERENNSNLRKRKNFIVINDGMTDSSDENCDINTTTTISTKRLRTTDN